MDFTPDEISYLRSQRLGRLATVDADGAPQNNPVGFFLDEDTGDLLVGGRDLARSRKFRNVRRNPHVAIVIDDLASVDPWRPRFVEIRGLAEALDDVDPPRRGMSRAVIRIHPTWIGSMGVELGTVGLQVRRNSRDRRHGHPGDAAPRCAVDRRSRQAATVMRASASTRMVSFGS